MSSCTTLQQHVADNMVEKSNHATSMIDATLMRATTWRLLAQEHAMPLKRTLIVN